MPNFSESCTAMLGGSPLAHVSPGEPMPEIEFMARIGQSNGPGAPPRGRPDLTYRTSRPGPARVNDDGRERVARWAHCEPGISPFGACVREGSRGSTYLSRFLQASAV